MPRRYRRSVPIITTHTLLAMLLLVLGLTSHAEELTLERIFASPALSGPSLRQAELSPAGDRVTFLRGRDEDRNVLDLWEYHLADQTTRRLIVADQVLADEGELSAEEQARRERARISGLRGIVHYRWSIDGTALLFPLGGNLYMATLGETDPHSTTTVRQLTATEDFDLDPKISPDGEQVAFIRNQNLWVVDLASNQARALTSDGQGTLSNGMAEFIAQEEMGRSTGYWWSP
ncbi:MAG: DPP IV N-terminal domain-containing protein, partial [Pseudomonadota bacterium]